MKSEKKDKRIGMICGIFTGSLWGLSGVFSQYLFSSTDMTSEWFVAVRMLLAGILMMGYTILTKKGEVCRMVTCKKDLFVCALTGIIGTMLFQFFCYGAVQCSNAATAIVLQYLCPVMVMVYACIKDRKLPQKKEILALCLAVGGIFLIATHGNIGELVITKKALIWGIGCAFFMSLTTIIPERLFHRYAAQTVTSFNLLFGGVAATLIVRPYRHVPVLDVKGIASLFLAILCGSLLAYMVYGVSIQKVGTSKASLYACAEIPAATVLSVLFLGSQFMWLDIVGFVLIGSTIFILSGAHSEKNLS